MMARHYRSIAAAAEGGEKSQSREEKLLISRDAEIASNGRDNSTQSASTQQHRRSGLQNPRIFD